MDARPVNPFITGGPVSASKFIGRRAQVDTILSQLANPENRGGSAISGGPRIGKTSLLHYIASPEAAVKYGLSQSQFTFVRVDAQTLGSYMDSQNIDTFSETVFWHYILRLLSIYETPSAEHPKELLEQERVGAHDLIPLFAQVAAEDKLVVLLLDEFEWIINNIDPQRPTLLHALRSLIDRPARERGIALTTSSKEPLNVLCSHIKFMGSPLPNALVRIDLRPFSTAEAYELIDEYLKGTAVAFSDEDKDFAYKLSEGHPYWLQRACFEMFNRYREHPDVLSGADRGAIASQIRGEITAGREEVKATAEERLQKLTLPEESQLQERIQELSERLSLVLGLVIFAIALAVARPWISGGLWWFVLTGLLLVLYISVLVAFRPMQKGHRGKAFTIGFPLMVVASIALPLGRGQTLLEVLGVVANIGGCVGLLLFVLTEDKDAP